MAIIGTFKATENGYEGRLESLTRKAKLTIEPATKNNDNQPNYRVFHIVKDFKPDVGAAWKKIAQREGGSEYLSVSIDDLSFPAVRLSPIPSSAPTPCSEMK